MKEFLEFGAIFFISFLNHLFGMILSIKNFTDKKYFYFFKSTFINWTYSLGEIFVVLYITINQPTGLLSIGINTTDKVDNIVSIFGGAFLVTIILSPILFLLNKFVFYKNNNKILDEEVLSQPHITEIINYKSEIERLVRLSVLPFEVISEDFIYRGYLVLLLGYRTGSFIPWAIISVLLSVAIHLYQSRKLENVVFHFLAATFFVGITLWTQNIFSSVGAHLLMNFVWMIGIWKKADKQGLGGQETVRNKKQTFVWLMFAILNLFAIFLFFVWLSY